MKEVQVIKANANIIHRGKGRELGILLRVAAYCRVSTDDEDQLNSYRSQVAYYTDMINKREDWTFAGVYADEGITGTQTSKREDFQRLINDCMAGKIDMIITKSISRFARNTVLIIPWTCTPFSRISMPIRILPILMILSAPIIISI